METPEKPQLLLPAHEPDPLAGIGTVTPEQMAGDLAASQPKATVSTAAPAQGAAAAPGPDPGKWGALRDQWGNAFDPVVHLTNKAGDPAITPTGRLMAKAGMRPTLKARARALKAGGRAAPAKGGTLRLEPDAGDPAPTHESQTTGPGPLHQVEADAGAAPERSREEVEDRAQSDAETVAGTEEIILDLLMPTTGDLPENERLRLERSAKRVMIQDKIELPFGAKLLHSLEFMRVFNRRAKTPEGQAHLARLSDSIQKVIQYLESRLSK